MPKSIAIVTPTFPPYRGGIGKLAELDARQLSSLGAEVHVFMPSGQAGKHAPGRDPGRTSGQPATGYQVHELRVFGRYGNAAFVPGVAGLPKRYPLVLLHYPFFGGAEPLYLAKLLTGRGRLLIAYHMDVVGRGPLRAFFAAHTRWCMPPILHQAERILVTSFDYAAHGNIAGLFASEPGRFREIPPSVDVGRFAPGQKPQALLDRYGLGAADKVVLFVGGLDGAHYFKGVPRLLEAMAADGLAGTKAVIVGGGGMQREYERMAARLGVAGRVVFAGPVSEDELPLHYRLGDVFVFPSVDRSEAFGIAALEAMASGLPVVASDLPGVRTIVRDGATGLRVFAGSSSALSLALAKLIGDEGLRRTMAKAARDMAVREYGDDARLEKWKAILIEMGAIKQLSD